MGLVLRRRYIRRRKKEGQMNGVQNVSSIQRLAREGGSSCQVFFRRRPARRIASKKLRSATASSEVSKIKEGCKMPPRPPKNGFIARGRGFQGLNPAKVPMKGLAARTPLPPARR